MLRRLKAFLRSRESTTLGRQRVLFFLVTAILSTVITEAFFFSLPRVRTVAIIDGISIVGAIVLVVLYLLHRLPIREASNLLYLLLQAEISAQMVYVSIFGEGQVTTMIIQGSFLSLLLIMISIVANLKYCPAVISVISLFTYFACFGITHERILIAFLPVYLVVLVGVIIYDTMALHNAQQLEMENFHLKKEVYDFMRVTGLSANDLRQITDLSGNAQDTEKTRLILSNMDARVRENIVGGVLAVKAQKESASAVLEKVFPDFTPTQIAIAQLILQDKKLTEISRILGKTENNISAQRSKMRSTLGIGADVSLKEALQEYLDAYLMVQEECK